jgi:tyrosinase
MAKSTLTNLSRRRVMAGAAATAAVGLAGATGAASAPVRTRYDIKTAQGRAMLDVYRLAVAKMKALPESDPLSWNFQANIHAHPYNREEAIALFADASPDIKLMALGENSDGKGGIWWTCTHSHDNLDGSQADSYATQFVSWHRLYVWHFERICEKMAGRPFSLPYWNYLDLSQLKLPSAVLSEKVRVDGKLVDNALYFPDRRPDFVTNGLRAIKGDPADTDITALQTMKTKVFFDISTSAGTSRDGFVTALDGSPHGSVHVRVGTNDGAGMGAFQTAARDPIFWLHHANIDRLWESWRVPGANGSSDKDPKAPKASAWLNKKFMFAGVDGKPSVKLASEALSLSGLGYRYDRLQPIQAILFAAPNAEQKVLSVTTVTQTSPGLGATVGAGNAPVSLHLYPAGTPDQAKALANDPGNTFWLVIDVQASNNPSSLFVVSLKATRRGTPVDLPVQTFNLFNAGMRRAEGEYFKTAWQMDISDLVHGGGVDLSKALEVTVKPVAGDSSGVVRVTGMRVEAQ